MLHCWLLTVRLGMCVPVTFSSGKHCSLWLPAGWQPLPAQQHHITEEHLQQADVAAGLCHTVSHVSHGRAVWQPDAAAAQRGMQPAEQLSLAGWQHQLPLCGSQGNAAVVCLFSAPLLAEGDQYECREPQPAPGYVSQRGAACGARESITAIHGYGCLTQW